MYLELLEPHEVGGIGVVLICPGVRHASLLLWPSHMGIKHSDIELRERTHSAGDVSQQACTVVDARKSIREKVSLISRLVLSSDPGKADWFGTVLNLSSVGMLVKIDQIQNIGTKAQIFATILFDDVYKTRLEMRCRVCRVLPDGTLVTLGIEFPFLSPLQREVLERYLVTVKASS
jgi:hypothetical protein